MNVIPVGTPVQVQLGPNIEAGTIEDGRFGTVKVRLGDNNLVKVERSKLVDYAEPKPQETPQENAARVAEVLGIPQMLLDRDPTDEEANLFVINDEWYGQLEAGDPFKEAADPYIKANPGRKFRFLGNATVKRHGKRGYQEVIDKATGKPVMVSGMTLASVPMHVHEERARRVAQLTDDQAASKQEPIRERLAEAGKEAGIGNAALDAWDTAKVLRQGVRGEDFRR